MENINNVKVGVVLLTYNRLSCLKISIQKVLNQTALPFEVLIVDNNSNDGTKEYLESFDNLSTLHLEDNLGPAGGFYYGIKYFNEKKNVDFLWLMDDDFFPSKTCLEELLKSADHKSIVYPYVRDKDFVTTLYPGWWGVLISAKIVEKVGYPNKELFFWKEDSEYLHGKIRNKNNFANRWIPSAKAVHFTSRSTNYRSPWRYYYEIRNSVYFRLHVNKITFYSLYRLAKSTSKLLGMIILKDDNKLEKLNYFLMGVYHGVINKMGKTVDPKLGFIKNNQKRIT